MMASQVVLVIKDPPANAGDGFDQTHQTWVWFLDQEDSLEEGMAIHSSILAWRISWTEESGSYSSQDHKESGMTKCLKTRLMILITIQKSALLSTHHLRWCLKLIQLTIILSFPINPLEIFVFFSESFMRAERNILTNWVLIVVQLQSHVWFSVTPCTAVPQSFTISWSMLKFMSIESVMPSSHLIFCQSLFFLLSIFPIFRIFSN